MLEERSRMNKKSERERARRDRDEWVSFHAGPPAPRPSAPHDLPGYNVVTHDLWLPNGELASGALQTNPRSIPTDDECLFRTLLLSTSFTTFVYLTAKLLSKFLVHFSLKYGKQWDIWWNIIHWEKCWPKMYICRAFLQSKYALEYVNTFIFSMFLWRFNQTLLETWLLFYLLL